METKTGTNTNLDSLPREARIEMMLLQLSRDVLAFRDGLSGSPNIGETVTSPTQPPATILPFEQRESPQKLTRAA